MTNHDATMADEGLDQRVRRSGAMEGWAALGMTIRVGLLLRESHATGIAHGRLAAASVRVSDEPVPAVTLADWPATPSPTLAEDRARDALALAGLLYCALTGRLPPFGRGVLGERPLLADPALDDRLLAAAWSVAGLPAPAPRLFASVEDALAALRPVYAQQAAALADETSSRLDVRFAREARSRRAQRDELAARLRFLDGWLTQHAVAIERAEATAATGEAALASVRRLAEALADEDAPPAEAAGATPAVPVLPAPVVPAPVVAAAVVEAPPRRAVTAAAAPTEPAPLPLEVTPPAAPALRSSHWREPSRRRRVPVAAAAVLAGAAAAVAGWQLSDEATATPAATRPATAGLIDAPLPPAAPAETAPAQTIPAKATPPEPRPAAALPVAVTADPPPVLDAEPEAPAEELPPIPPAGMVLVPAGPVHLGLTADQRAALVARCHAELGARGDCEIRFDADPAAAEGSLPAFFIDRQEVTLDDWRDCRAERACARYHRNWPTPEHPVVGVSREMAATYCAWRGARLPTADEWIRAARGDDERLHPWGDAPPVESDEHRANFAGRADGHAYAAPVIAFGARGQSPWGVENLAGNVREWTADTTADGQAVVLGGSYRDAAVDLRITRRERVAPASWAPDLGFRCVQDLE